MLPVPDCELLPWEEALPGEEPDVDAVPSEGLFEPGMLPEPEGILLELCWDPEELLWELLLEELDWLLELEDGDDGIEEELEDGDGEEGMLDELEDGELEDELDELEDELEELEEELEDELLEELDEEVVSQAHTISPASVTSKVLPSVLAVTVTDDGVGIVSSCPG